MGDVVVFTGTLTTQTRKEATAEAEAHGYVVGGSITKSTTYLVCGEKVGAKKIADAEKAGVTVMSEAEWKEKLSSSGEGAGDDDDEVMQDAEGEEEEEEEEEEEKRPTRKGRAAKASSPTKTAPAKAQRAKATMASAGGQGEVVVFTGTLTTQTRKEATAEAEAHGYVVGGSITKSTTYLVCGEKVGAKKIADAEKAGVTVMSEAEWKEKLTGGEGAGPDEGAGDDDVDADEVVNVDVDDDCDDDEDVEKTRRRHRKVMASTTSGVGKDVVVFTGTLMTQTRKEATAAAKAAGYKVGTSITAATTILVYGEKAGKKLEDAQERGIQLFSEEEWQSKLEGGETGLGDSGRAMRQVVVFAGNLSRQPLADAIAQAETHGYVVSTSIMPETTILVCGGETAVKMKGTPHLAGFFTIYSEDEWATKLSSEASKASPPVTSSAVATVATTTDQTTTRTNKSTKGNIVVFTGTLTTQTRKEATAEAEAHGYVVGGSITKSTTYLVCGEKVGAKKIADAEKAGVTVMSEAEWKEKLHWDARQVLAKGCDSRG